MPAKPTSTVGFLKSLLLSTSFLLVLHSFPFPFLSAQAQDTTLITHSREEISSREKEMQDSRHLLVATAQMEELLQSASEFSTEELALITRGEWQELDQDKKLIVQQMQFWSQEQSLWQEEQNQLILDKQEYLMQVGKTKIEATWKELSEGKKTALKDLKENIDDTFAKWLPHRRSIEGDPKSSRQRMVHFEKFFRLSMEFVQKIGRKKHSVMSPLLTMAELPCVYRPHLGQLMSGGTLLASTGLGAFSSMLWWDPTQSSRTPVTSNLNKVFTHMSQTGHYKVNITGQENIAPLLAAQKHSAAEAKLAEDREDKTINLFLPPHRWAIPDAMLMGNINLPHYLLFGNPNSFLPAKFMADKLADVPEFIAVGQWRGSENLTPHEKLLKSLKNNVGKNVWNYAQGFTASMNEILPINSSFSEKMVGNLLSEGYSVNIIPISSEVPSSFLSDHTLVNGDHFSAKIHAPITAPQVQLLLAVERGTKGKLLADYMRAKWNEEIKEYGELSLEEIEKRMELVLEPNVEDSTAAAASTSLFPFW